MKKTLLTIAVEVCCHDSRLDLQSGNVFNRGVMFVWCSQSTQLRQVLISLLFHASARMQSSDACIFVYLLVLLFDQIDESNRWLSEQNHLNTN